jgi:DNA-binding IclR family transcriptional regulator
MTVPLGTAVPIRRTGALDAFFPEADRAALPATGGTVASAATLATVRRQGFYVVDQLYPNSVATGAPITDGQGAVIASLNVVGPKVRIGKATARRFGELTAVAARSISDSLSGSEA